MKLLASLRSGCVRDAFGMKVLKKIEAVSPKFLPCKSQVSPIFLQREWENEGRMEGGWREENLIVAYARMPCNNNHMEVV